MLILQPIVHETIWGGSKLTPYSESSCEKIGHLYSVCCNEGQSNQILNGAYKGRTFQEYFVSHKKSFGLGRHAFFPLIIALVEAKEHLSIQVHPDDQTAPFVSTKTKLGKNESWFFLDAPEDGSIYDGCLCKSMEALKSSIAGGNMEAVTDRLSVKKGDYVYIEAGTLHAMAKGSLVYEIEENAGDTYRFYDFDRVGADGKRRPLQIPEAFYSIHLENKSRVLRYEDTPVIEEEKYITQYVSNMTDYENKSGTLEVFTVLGGTCILEGIPVQKGMSVILEPGESIRIDETEAIVAQPKITGAELI